MFAAVLGGRVALGRGRGAGSNRTESSVIRTTRSAERPRIVCNL
ncbi:hypothetical protein YT1_0495 [Rhodococcus ruber]|nr:hypothetical protein YT1_0495 [Rhodococcus ruber]